MFSQAAGDRCAHGRGRCHRRAATGRGTLSAFVAGATGYTGRALVQNLVERGERTVAHVRPDSPQLPEWRETFAELGAEVSTAAWELAELTEAVREIGPTVVFGALGTTRKHAAAAGMSAPEGYERVDYGLTVMLLEATRQAAPRARFVYVSVAVARAGSGSAYVDARWRAEEAIRGSGVPYTIVRPALITGPGRHERRPAERVAGVLTGGLTSFAAAVGARKLASRYRPLTNVELAEGMVRVAYDPAHENRIVDGSDLQGV